MERLEECKGMLYFLARFSGKVSRLEKSVSESIPIP